MYSGCADDSPDVRRNLRAILEEHSGWNVCGEAENGMEAIEKAKELQPDTVILDLSMPVMNGLDAAREIRKLLPSAQLFLFSAFHTENLRGDCAQRGNRCLHPEVGRAGSALARGSIRGRLLTRIDTDLPPKDCEPPPSTVDQPSFLVAVVGVLQFP